MTSVFSDVNSIDGSIGVDACDSGVEVVVVIVVDDAMVADGDPHITLRLPFDTPEIK